MRRRVQALLLFSIFGDGGEVADAGGLIAAHSGCVNVFLWEASIVAHVATR